MSFSLRATLGLDASNFESVLLAQERASKASGRRMKENLEGDGFFGGGFGERIAEGLGVFEVARFAQELVEAGTRVRALSVDLGISAEAVQVYERAFDGLDHVPAALDKLAKAKESALGDDKDAQKMADAFQRLGISADQLQNLSLEKLFEAIGENIRGSTIDTQKLSDELEILGKTGTSLNEGFKRGLGEVQEELKKTGAMLDETTLRGDRDVHEFEQTVWGSFKGILNKSMIGLVELVQAPFGKGGLAEGFKKQADMVSGDRLDFQQRAWLKDSEERKAKRIADAKEASDKEKAAQAAASDAKTKDYVDSVALDQQRAEIEERTRQAALTDEQKRMELTRQRAALSQRVGFATSDVAESELKLAIAQLDEQLQQIKPEKIEKAAERHHEQVNVNEAQRTGAYVYQAASVDLTRKSVDHLASIDRRLAQIASKHGAF